MHRALASVSHRPWPVPARPWAMAMSWHDLLFAHWPVAAGIVLPRLPPRLLFARRLDVVGWAPERVAR